MHFEKGMSHIRGLWNSCGQLNLSEDGQTDTDFEECNWVKRSACQNLYMILPEKNNNV